MNGNATLVGTTFEWDFSSRGGLNMISIIWVKTKCTNKDCMASFMRIMEILTIRGEEESVNRGDNA